MSKVNMFFAMLKLGYYGEDSKGRPSRIIQPQACNIVEIFNARGSETVWGCNWDWRNEQSTSYLRWARKNTNDMFSVKPQLSTSRIWKSPKFWAVQKWSILAKPNLRFSSRISRNWVCGESSSTLDQFSILCGKFSVFFWTNEIWIKFEFVTRIIWENCWKLLPSINYQLVLEELVLMKLINILISMISNSMISCRKIGSL